MITTVVPTYRRPHLLSRAISSVLQQTFSDFRVHVCDNHSEDGTVELVEEWMRKDARIFLLQSDATIDAVANIQRGLNSVTTPFFSILSDDDLVAPQFFSIALATLKKFPSAYFFSGSTIDIHANGKIISADALHWGSEEYYPPPSGALAFAKHYFNWTGSLFSLPVREAVPLNPRVKVIDYDFMIRAAIRYPFVVSKGMCALFIQHQTSYSQCCGLKLAWPSWQFLSPPILESLAEKATRETMATLLHKKWEHILYSLALKSLLRRNFHEIKEVLAVLLQQSAQNAMGKKINSFLPFLERHQWSIKAIQRLFALYRLIKSFPARRKYGREVRVLHRLHCMEDASKKKK